MNQGLDQTPGSMLEIYMHAIQNSTGDSFLDEINLGIGNYEDDEYWQQMEAFRNGLYADSSMTSRVIERAILETKKRMVDSKFDDRGGKRILRHVDMPEPSDGIPKEKYFEEHMEDVWENLGVDSEDMQYTTQQHQAWLVHTCTGIGMEWTPPHWRMLMARHEASRSRGARLLDNVFGRPPEPDVRPMEDFPQ